MTQNFWLSHYPKGMPATLDALEYTSLAHFFEDAVERYSDYPAFTSNGTTYSYAEWGAKSHALANFLQFGLGLTRQQRVAIMLPNLLQYPVALFAILRAGLIVVNTNPLYTARELKYQLVDSEASAIIILENFAHVLEPILADTAVEHVILTNVGDAFPALKSVMTNWVVRHIKKMVPKYHLPMAISYTKALTTGIAYPDSSTFLEQDDIAFLQYTGGTTGVSKGAMLTHGNMLANTAQAVSWITHGNLAGKEIVEGKEVVLTALPLYHIFALTANCLIFIQLGAHNHLVVNPRDMKSLIKTLKSDHFTCMTGVNTLYAGMLKAPSIKQVDFSSFKICLAGGMATRKDVANDWRQLTGCTLIEAYGLTEASPAVTINPLNQQTFTGSIGQPIASTGCEIRDDHGQPVAIGEPGELFVHGPQVMKGYWHHPEETAKEITQDGWLKTGDMGRFDEQGFIYLLDRKKDMILVSGFNVYPNEVEAVITHHPDVVECGVVGITDDKSGEAVKAYVVKRCESLTAEALITYCRIHLTGYKIPKLIEFRKELPKSTVGKILRKELRAKEA